MTAYKKHKRYPIFILNRDLDKILEILKEKIGEDHAWIAIIEIERYRIQDRK